MAAKKKPLFTIEAEDLARQSALNKDLIAQTLFILPKNDGEAARSCQILTAVKAPYVHISRQSWGATLDAEWNRIPGAFWQNEDIKKVAIFEMPGTAKAMGDTIESEAKIAQAGKELIIIDHHHYKWVERHHSLSSLEQLCQLIGWQLSETDQAIAVNDRSYIPGLKALGLDAEAIRRVRLFDLEHQGNSRNYIEKQIQKARAQILELESKRIGKLWVLDNEEYKQPYIMQELSIAAPTGLAHAYEIKLHKLGFSGDPHTVNRLMERDFSHWETITGPLIHYGGGDGKSSKFWGIKTTENRKSIPESMARETLEFILGCHDWRES